MKEAVEEMARERRAVVVREQSSEVRGTSNWVIELYVRQRSEGGQRVAAEREENAKMHRGANLQGPEIRVGPPLDGVVPSPQHRPVAARALPDGHRPPQRSGAPSGLHLRQSHRDWSAFSTDISAFRKPVDAKVFVSARRERPLREAQAILNVEPPDGRGFGSAEDGMFQQDLAREGLLPFRDAG